MSRCTDCSNWGNCSVNGETEFYGKIACVDNVEDLCKGFMLPCKPTIKDSGARREFSSGAVRDIQEGKGRCDLMPLDAVANIISIKEISSVLNSISLFMDSGNVDYINRAIQSFCNYHCWQPEDALLEVSIHYEEGAKKYGERNWEKGIPLHCYIDSGVRHLLKYTRGDTDEPHDRAFIWNMLGLIWTVKHKPELCDIPVFPIKKDAKTPTTDITN